MAKRSLLNAIEQITPAVKRGLRTLASDARRTTNMSVLRATNTLERKGLLPKRQAVRIRDAVRMQHVKDMIQAGDDYATSVLQRVYAGKIPRDARNSAVGQAYDDLKQSAGSRYFENPQAKRAVRLSNRAHKKNWEIYSKYGDRNFTDPMKEMVIDHRTNRIVGYRDFRGEKAKAYADYDVMNSGVERAYQKANVIHNKMAEQYRKARRLAGLSAGVLGAGVLGGIAVNHYSDRPHPNSKRTLKKQVGVGEMMYIHDNVLGHYGTPLHRSAQKTRR